MAARTPSASTPGPRWQNRWRTPQPVAGVSGSITESVYGRRRLFLGAGRCPGQKRWHRRGDVDKLGGGTAELGGAAVVALAVVALAVVAVSVARGEPGNKLPDEHRQWHVDLGLGPVGLEHPVVVGLGELGELGIVIRTAVDERARPALDDRDHVLAGERLVGLERVGHREDGQAVFGDQLVGPVEQLLERSEERRV